MSEQTVPDPERLKVYIASETSLEHKNGVATSILNILPTFRALGDDVHILCPKPAKASYEGFSTTKTQRVRLKHFDFSLGVPMYPTVKQDIERHRPDVLYAANPFGFLGEFALLAARDLGVPIVANYQTRLGAYGDNFSKTVLKLAAIRSFMLEQYQTSVAQRTKRLYDLATTALVPSDASRKDLLDYGVTTPIVEWGRGVDGVLYNPQRKTSETVQSLKESWQEHDGQPIVLYVGRLAPEKNLEQFAQLAGLDARIVIVGKGDKHYTDTLKKIVPEGTIFTGQLSGEALADAYAAADIFAHTGLEETFGQTLQEAMAAGLPVIAPARGGPLSIVKNNETGLLYETHDTTSFAHAVQHIMDDPPLRESMGRAGRAAVENKTWESYALRLREILLASSHERRQLGSSALKLTHLKTGTLPVAYM